MNIGRVTDLDDQPIAFIPDTSRHCAHCKVVQHELYSRTHLGKEYCLECLKKGAGIDDLISSHLDGFISDKLYALALENGFIKKEDLPPCFNQTCVTPC